MSDYLENSRPQEWAGMDLKIYSRKMDDRKVPATIYHSWGHAKILFRNDSVCSKELNFHLGHKTSLHYHMRRQETLYCQSGLFTLRVFNSKRAQIEEFKFYQGQSIDIERGNPHQIVCLESGVIIETSLTYQEEDVVRIYDDSVLMRGPSMR